MLYYLSFRQGPCPAVLTHTRRILLFYLPCALLSTTSFFACLTPNPPQKPNFLLDLTGRYGYNICDCLLTALEVYSINKQKFLAELGRLLTFMYEEDRQTALAMYNRLFDMTDDEQALLQFLVSPTRQAVVLARKYDAAERKLHVHSQHRDPAQAESADTPPFVLAIEKLEQEVLSFCSPAPVVDTDQISLFEDDVSALEDRAPVPQDEAPLPQPKADDADGLFSLDAVDASSAREEPAARFSLDAVTDEPEGPAPSDPAPAVPVSEAAPSEAIPAVDAAEQADTPAPADEDAPASPAEAQDAAPLAAESDSPDAPAPEQSAPVDKVDAFLSDFSIRDDASVAQSAGAAPVPMKQPEGSADMPSLDAALSPLPAGTVRKARVPLLILYSIAAVVVGLIGVVILLIPTLLSLSCAVSLGAASFTLLGSAFSSFTMFADILAVLGVALIVFALALLFAWLFFWLIGGAICGLIRGLCRLGGKCCFKEVPAV